MAVFNEVLASVESFIVLGVLITGVSFIGKTRGQFIPIYEGEKISMQYIPGSSHI